MAFLGSLFHPGRRPDQSDASLFSDFMAGSGGSSDALANLAASTGTYAPAQSFDAPMSPLPANRSPVPQAAPAAAPAPAPASTPSLSAGMPDDAKAKLTQYAGELGIPVGPHKFNWGHALLSFFGGAQVAQMYLNGNYPGAARLDLEHEATAAQGRDRQAALMHQLSVYGAMRENGLSKNDAILAMTNLEKFGENYNTRFRTDNIAEGYTRFQPNLNGTPSTFTAPKLVQHGPDYAFVTPPDPSAGGISSTGGPPTLDGNGAGSPLPAGAPSAPMLPAAPSQNYALGNSGRQISIPGADDGAADAFVRQGINSGAAPDQIATGLQRNFGYSADTIQRLMPSLTQAAEWKQRNPDRLHDAPIVLGNPGPSMQSGPMQSGPMSAPMLGAPRATIAGAGSLRTDAEQYADTLYERGTPQWRGAVQDAMLKANGPTAFGQDQQLQGERLAVQRRGQDIDQGNNIRTTSTEAANNERSTNASISNNRNRPAAVGIDPNGNTAIIYPDNRVVRTQGIRPVSAAARRGRQGGGAGGGSEGLTAVAKNGHRIVVRGGRWVDAQTGAPVQ